MAHHAQYQDVPQIHSVAARIFFSFQDCVFQYYKCLFVQLGGCEYSLQTKQYRGHLVSAFYPDLYLTYRGGSKAQLLIETFAHLCIFFLPISEPKVENQNELKNPLADSRKYLSPKPIPLIGKCEDLLCSLADTK